MRRRVKKCLLANPWCYEGFELRDGEERASWFTEPVTPFTLTQTRAHDLMGLVRLSMYEEAAAQKDGRRAPSDQQPYEHYAWVCEAAYWCNRSRGLCQSCGLEMTLHRPPMEDRDVLYDEDGVAIKPKMRYDPHTATLQRR